MIDRASRMVIALVVASVALSQTGCFWMMQSGPNIGPMAIPIPVPVGIQKNKEDQFHVIYLKRDSNRVKAKYCAASDYNGNNVFQR